MERAKQVDIAKGAGNARPFSVPRRLRSQRDLHSHALGDTSDGELNLSLIQPGDTSIENQQALTHIRSQRRSKAKEARLRKASQERFARKSERHPEAPYGLFSETLECVPMTDKYAGPAAFNSHMLHNARVQFFDSRFPTINRVAAKIASAKHTKHKNGLMSLHKALSEIWRRLNAEVPHAQVPFLHNSSSRPVPLQQRLCHAANRCLCDEVGRKIIKSKNRLDSFLRYAWHGSEKRKQLCRGEAVVALLSIVPDRDDKGELFVPNTAHVHSIRWVIAAHLSKKPFRASWAGLELVGTSVVEVSRLEDGLANVNIDVIELGASHTFFTSWQLPADLDFRYQWEALAFDIAYINTIVGRFQPMRLEARLGHASRFLIWTPCKAKRAVRQQLLEWGDDEISEGGGLGGGRSADSSEPHEHATSDEEPGASSPSHHSHSGGESSFGSFSSVGVPTPESSDSGEIVGGPSGPSAPPPVIPVVHGGLAPASSAAGSLPTAADAARRPAQCRVDLPGKTGYIVFYLSARKFKAVCLCEDHGLPGDPPCTRTRQGHQTERVGSGRPVGFHSRSRLSQFFYHYCNFYLQPTIITTINIY